MKFADKTIVSIYPLGGCLMAVPFYIPDAGIAGLIASLYA